MRHFFVRTTAAALAATVTVAAADPPTMLPPPKPLDEPRKLRTELESLAADREAAAKELTASPSTAAERAKLREQLLELIKKVGEKKAASAVPATPHSPAHPSPTHAKEPTTPGAGPKFLPGDGYGPLDPVRAAQNYFRADDVDAALRTLKLVDMDALSREERAFVQYLKACCCRKTNQTAEAMRLFREVADAKEDEFLAEYAVWQLSTMKSTTELESNLEQLRSRRKSK